MENDELAIAQIPLPKYQGRRHLEQRREIKVTVNIFDIGEGAKVEVSCKESGKDGSSGK